MVLTDTAIRNAKPADKPYKVTDSQGLYLLVNPRGSKLWRIKYRIDGVERKLSLGAYPEITLAEARAARDAARRQLAHAIDPNVAKRQARIEASIRASNSFASVAEELIEKKAREGLAEPTLEKMRWFVKLMGADFGKRPVADITPQELLHELQKHERRGRLETANLLRAFASRVFRFAVATARAERDPAQLLIGALTTPRVKHFAAIIDPDEFGALLRAIEDYQGDPAVIYALKLTPHVFQRPGELRQMEWAEVNFDKAVWTIPVTKMKMRQPHSVPLSRQALAILQAMRSLSGSGRYVFPSIRTRARPISENTINAALRRMGYSKEQMTAHGFRTSASSLLNESGKWNPDAIERALAHMVAGSVRRIYNQSAYWAERVEMAQWWSDYMDELRKGGNCQSASKR
ncbi:site-specific integrase, partial [Sphingobium sp. Z007]